MLLKVKDKVGVAWGSHISELAEEFISSHSWEGHKFTS